MEIYIKEYGKLTSGASSIIELTIKNCGSTIAADVTNLHGYVDEDFIHSLKNIVDILEEQNKTLEEAEEE